MPKEHAAEAARNAHAEIAPLTNVHDALQRAKLADRDKVRLVNATIKLDPLKKEAAESLCDKGGTSLSAFLRECVDGLLFDYMGAKSFRQLQGASSTPK